MSGGKSLIGGGLDWSKYNPIEDFTYISNDSTPSGNSIILKQINGKGYINEILLFTSLSNSGSIKITIDGVVVINDTMIESNRNFGILNKNSITHNGSSIALLLMYSNKVINTMSITSGYNNQYNTGTKTKIIEDQLFFNSSLLVEYVSSTTTAKNLTFNMSGGYM